MESSIPFVQVICRTLGWTLSSNRLLTLEIGVELLNPEQFSYTLTSPPDLVPTFMFLKGSPSHLTFFFHLPQPVSLPKIWNYSLLTLEFVPFSPLMPHLILTQVYRCSPELPISTRSNLPASQADWVSPKLKRRFPWPPWSTDENHRLSMLWLPPTISTFSHIAELLFLRLILLCLTCLYVTCSFCLEHLCPDFLQCPGWVLFLRAPEHLLYTRASFMADSPVSLVCISAPVDSCFWSQGLSIILSLCT